jgi:hypothetical protein
MNLKTIGIFGGFIVSCFLSSCIKEEKSGIINPLYFDVSGMIDKQITQLKSHQSNLKKVLRIEESVESKVINNVNWNQELEVFKTIDINSPVLRETFNVDTSIHNNQKKVVYQPKESTVKGVSNLVLTLDSANNLRELTAIFKTDNILYSSEKDFHLAFESEKKSLILKSYRIDTKERLLFRKSCGNTIKGEVISSSF